jgi:hypothetical protein
MTATDATFLALGILAIVAVCLWSVDRELTERARRQRLQRQIALLDDAVSEAGVIRIFPCHHRASTRGDSISAFGAIVESTPHCESMGHLRECVSRAS